MIQRFGFGAVEITEPVLVNAFTKEQEYLRSLEADRLLAGFRETAGLEQKAERYTGGWENGEISGHTLGHYMVAMAQFYATTGEADVKERLEYVVEELALCQAENGYLFTSGEEIFNKLEKGGLVWMPWYTMHKILSGLIAVYREVSITKALTIAEGISGWICRRVLKWSDKERRKTLCVADGGMNDCLYELYRENGNEDLLKAAAKFEEIELFEQVAEGKDILAHKHAANTIPKFLGAASRYKCLGESEQFYLDAAKAFFDMVVTEHTYAIGGNGELEHFRIPGALRKGRTRYNCETCSSYNMLKLAERLYLMTGEKRYMDFYERTFFNAILGSQNPETGMTTFFQPMENGFFKTFAKPYKRFWCCTGTGMESFTKLNRGIYHKDAEKLYVNMYIASVLQVEDFGLQMTQTADIDSFERASFSMRLSAPKQFTLCLRVPEWSGSVPEVTVNGKARECTEEGGYLVLDENWKDGDRITVKLFPRVTFRPLPDGENCMAAMYGPLVLAAGMGQDDMTVELMGANVVVPTKNMKVRDRIVLKPGQNMADWFVADNENFVKQEGEAVFTLKGTDADGELVFTPYYKKYDERYGIYFDYYDDENLPDDLRAIKEEEERLAAEAARKAEEERLRKEEEERLRREAEEEAARKAEEERLRKEEEERLRREAEAEAARKAEEERLRKEEEERLRKEEEARLAAEAARKAEEERLRKEEEARLAAEEAARKAEEERLRKEEEARLAAEEAARKAEEERLRKEEEARLAAEEAARKAEEERLRKEEEARLAAEEAARKAEEERLRKEEEARLAAEEAARKAEEERIRKEEEARRAEEERIRKEEEARLAAEEAARKAEEERIRKEEEARLAAEEATRKAEEERIRKEEEARRAEEERIRKEEEVRCAEEERIRKEEEVRLAEEEAARLAAEEEKRIEAEAKREAAQKVADAERAAELAEANLREEEAALQAAKLAAERAEVEASTLKAQADAEAARLAKAEGAKKLEKMQKATDKATKKAKKKRRRRGRSFSGGKFFAWLLVILAVVVLLYVFATPISKGFFAGKDKVDTFLAEKFPKVASFLNVKGNGDAVPIFKDSTSVEYFAENAETMVSETKWPQGYHAEVVRLNGKEYICIEGNGLKAYYVNEAGENESKHVYLEKGDQKAMYFWDYSFDKPENLCPVSGVYNSEGVEQYVIYTNTAEDNVHILDAETLEECKVIADKEAMKEILVVEDYISEEQRVRINLKAGEVSYSFLVPKKVGLAIPEDYEITLDNFTYALEDGGVVFEASVMSTDVYLGKLAGKTEYVNRAYAVTETEFLAYAEENFGEGEEKGIPAVSLEKTQKERIRVTGDAGEQLLVPVRDDVKRYEYKAEDFLAEKDGEVRYIRDGKTVSAKGITVSGLSGNIDWEKVAASGVDYAMIRLGVRGDEAGGKCQLDGNFKNNIKNAAAAGLEIGVYFESRATSVEEAKEEAKFVIDSLQGYNITWPVALTTTEEVGASATRASSLTKEKRTECAKAFMEDIKAAGYDTVLYADARWAVLKYDLGQLGSYDLWHAASGEDENYPYHYTMWQYRNAEVPGVSGTVDINLGFKNYGESKKQEQ